MTKRTEQQRQKVSFLGALTVTTLALGILKWFELLFSIPAVKKLASLLADNAVLIWSMFSIGAIILGGEYLFLTQLAEYGWM